MIFQQRKTHSGWLLSFGNSPKLLKELAPGLLKLLKKYKGKKEFSFLIENKTCKDTSKTKLQTTVLNEHG